MRLAYVLGQYPLASEAFLQREMTGLCGRGHTITVCALRRAPGQSVPASRSGVSPNVLHRPPFLSREAITSLVWLIAARPTRLVRLLGVLCLVLRCSPRTFVCALRNMHAIAFFSRRLDEVRTEHVHGGFVNVPGLLAMAIAVVNNVPFSIAGHARDVFVEGVLLPLLAQKAQFVVFCNQAAHDAGRRLVGETARAKFHVLHHGLDLERWASSIDRPARSPGEVPLLLAVGRFVEKKGFDVLIRACALLRDRGVTFRMEFYGDGPGRKKIEDLIDELGLQRHVVLRGWCSDADLIEAYCSAAAIICPSVRAKDGDLDGIPNVLLEATACGTFMLASRLTGLMEYVEDGRTGLLFEPGNPADLADAIAKALADPELRRRLAANARDRLGQAFDLQRNVAGLDALFSRVNSV
jgi:glycosyltransferase involved in cell wall biosynthesis